MEHEITCYMDEHDRWTEHAICLCGGKWERDFGVMKVWDDTTWDFRPQNEEAKKCTLMKQLWFQHIMRGLYCEAAKCGIRMTVGA